MDDMEPGVDPMNPKINKTLRFDYETAWDFFILMSSKL
jgi:hypothetical protein